MNQRIAYISAKFPLPSETFVYREVRGLRQRGWHVLAVSLNRVDDTLEHDLAMDRFILYQPSNLVAIGLEILTHPIKTMGTQRNAFDDMFSPGEPLGWRQRLKLPFQALASLALARRLRSEGIARIHCHFAHAPTTVGMYSAAQLGIPFSFTGHANDLFQRRCLLKKKLQRAGFVACISEWHRDWYNSICSAFTGKYDVIRCGVDVDQFKPGVVRAEQGSTTILSIGRLVEKKGFDTLIRAAGILHKEHISLKLTIAGDGPDGPRLRQLADELRVGSIIHWLGQIDNRRAPELLAQADIFALPCRADARGDKDGIPVVLMEAMAAGLPTVAGDLPAIRELIDDGKSGFLIDGTNPQALADRIRELIPDADLRHALGSAGRKRVVEEFAFDANLSKLTTMLQR